MSWMCAVLWCCLFSVRKFISAVKTGHVASHFLGGTRESWRVKDKFGCQLPPEPQMSMYLIKSRLGSNCFQNEFLYLYLLYFRWLSKMSPTSSSVSSGIIRRRGSEVEMSAVVVVITVILMCIILLGLYFFYEYLGTFQPASDVSYSRSAQCPVWGKKTFASLDN